MGEASAERAVGVDLGGTNVRVGCLTPSGQIERKLSQPTSDSPEKVVDQIVGLIDELGLRGLPVGVGAAGLVDRAGQVRFAPNLDWRDVGLGEQLADRLGISVTVENDANIAAWGEYRAGAGRQAGESMVMLTVGTGVGGGLVVDDRLVRGSGGLGAEFGHMVVLEGGPLCTCGNRGCLEALASGTAIGRVATEARAHASLPLESRLAHHAPITGVEVTRAAQAGDAFAEEVLAVCGFWLGVGIAGLVNALDPELVVIGGGVASAGELLLEPAREACAERVLGAGHREFAPIVEAELSGEAGLIGAGLLALGG